MAYLGFKVSSFLGLRGVENQNTGEPIGKEIGRRNGDWANTYLGFLGFELAREESKSTRLCILWSFAISFVDCR